MTTTTHNNAGVIRRAAYQGPPELAAAVKPHVRARMSHPACVPIST